MNGWDGGPAGEMAERNREIVAQRSGYPPETVEGCREIERACPGYFAWYGVSHMPGQDHTPRYGACRTPSRWGDPDYRGDTPAAVVAAIRTGERMS